MDEYLEYLIKRVDEYKELEEGWDPEGDWDGSKPIDPEMIDFAIDFFTRLYEQTGTVKGWCTCPTPEGYIDLTWHSSKPRDKALLYIFGKEGYEVKAVYCYWDNPQDHSGYHPTSCEIKKEDVLDFAIKFIEGPKEYTDEQFYADLRKSKIALNELIKEAIEEDKRGETMEFPVSDTIKTMAEKAREEHRQGKTRKFPCEKRK